MDKTKMTTPEGLSCANAPATTIPEEKIAENHNTFVALLNECTRPGMDRLIAFLESSDFFSAPASGRYHNNYKGGLCEHSLNVFYCLERKIRLMETMFPKFPVYSRETLIIAALLHDFAKINFYRPTARNQKVYCPNGSKFDQFGAFEWETVIGYEVEDSAPLTHGEKSMVGVMRYINLSKAEMYAIRWHMGFTEPSEHYNCIRDAYELYRLCLALHEADMEATYYLEGRDSIG